MVRSGVVAHTRSISEWSGVGWKGAGGGKGVEEREVLGLCRLQTQLWLDVIDGVQGTTGTRHESGAGCHER